MTRPPIIVALKTRYETTGLSTLWIWARALYRSISAEGLDYRATSLAYTTLLTIVPGLAFIFSMLKAFGVNRYLEPFLLELLAPLGEKATVVTSKILEIVTQVNVGVLGFMGLLSLLYVSISMLGKIEMAFNHIWRITQPRNLVRRIGDYLSVILLGPLLMFSAIGLTTTLPGMDILQRLVAYEPFGTLIFLGGKLLSLLLVVAAFSFVYLYIPNTRVPWRVALMGGVVGGVAWKLAGLIFTHFVSTSANYNALYSGLVIVVLFMVWLDMSWLVLLLGGQAAMFFQHPYYLQGFERFEDLGSRIREGLGLSLMTLIARRFIASQPAWTVDELAQRLSLPWVTVKEALDLLQHGRLVEETNRDDNSFLPSRDIAGVSIREILLIMRAGQYGEDVAKGSQITGLLPEVALLMGNLENLASDSEWARMSLREFACRQGHDQAI